jgi:hypothetical protein
MVRVLLDAPVKRLAVIAFVRAPEVEVSSWGAKPERTRPSWTRTANTSAALADETNSIFIYYSRRAIRPGSVSMVLAHAVSTVQSGVY